MGLTLSLGSMAGPAPQVKRPDENLSLLLQAEIVARGPQTSEGVLVRAVGLPWLEIADALVRDPAFLYQFAENARKFEEFLAACYERAGFDEVILTPQRGDRGRDVIAIKHGYGSVRFLDQAKAFKHGRRVTHGDVREMLGALSLDPGASKGIITTTSTFEPGVFGADSGFAPFLPHRLELKDGDATRNWVKELRGTSRD